VLGNSTLGPAFESLWKLPFGVQLGGNGFLLPLLDWVNHGMLSIFFLVVGLEIKREFTVGHLATLRSGALPVVAAFGGIVLPIGIYLLIAPSGPLSAGWGVPIATDTAFAVALIVPPASPLRTAGDLLARMRREPGAVNLGTISVGSTQHLAAELFKMQAGASAETVTFPATPTLITALLRGDVDAAFEITGPIWGQIEGGQLRPVAVTSGERAANLPQVPTLRESGLPDYDVSSWNALVAPARTPAEVIEKLNQEANAVLAMPEVRRRLLEVGVEARGSTPEALRDLLASEVEKWREVIEKARIERQ